MCASVCLCARALYTYIHVYLYLYSIRANIRSAGKGFRWRRCPRPVNPFCARCQDGRGSKRRRRQRTKRGPDVELAQTGGGGERGRGPSDRRANRAKTTAVAAPTTSAAADRRRRRRRDFRSGDVVVGTDRRGPTAAKFSVVTRLDVSDGRARSQT